MNEFNLRGPRTIEQMESDLADLAQRETHTPTVLRLPVQHESLIAGGLPSTLQVVTAWAETQPPGQRIVKIDFQASGTGSFDELFQEDHLVLACLLADSIQDETGLDISDESQEAIVRRHRSIETTGEHRDLHQSVLSLNSVGALDLVSQLTNKMGPKDEIAPEPDADQIETLLHTIFGLMTPEDAISWPILHESSPETRDDLTHELHELMFELIENAYLWGRSKWLSAGRTLDFEQGLRFFRAEVLDASLIELTEAAGTGSPFQEYLAASVPRYLWGPGNLGIDFSAKILELTFFDSGEGLAYWMAAAGEPLGLLTFSDEVKYTAAALQKGSGARETMFFLSGQGIPRALKAISKLGGFVHLRTGRMSVFRDFVNEPHDHDEDITSTALLETEPHFSYFRDWSNLQQGPFTTFGMARGTAYTVLLPISGQRRERFRK